MKIDPDLDKLLSDTHTFDPMAPCVSYYGGKQRMASKIIPLIPQHTVYVEPFCGGATILFKKPWPEVNNTDYYREVINDTDGRLINFYRQLQNNGDKLCRMLELTPYSEQIYRESSRENLDTGSDLERAVKYFVNIQQSFSNKLNSGWGRSVFGRNHGTTWANKSHNLHQYIERMASVYICCTDAIKCIEQWDSPQTFFYCDPPYPGTHQGHYSGYSVADFEALVDTLNTCEGSFLLSNYDQPYVAIPRDWERYDFSAASSAAYVKKGKQPRNKRTEVVWRRFNRVPVRQEIQKLYDSGKFDCFSPKPQETCTKLDPDLDDLLYCKLA